MLRRQVGQRTVNKRVLVSRPFPVYMMWRSVMDTCVIVILIVCVCVYAYVCMCVLLSPVICCAVSFSHSVVSSCEMGIVVSDIVYRNAPMRGNMRYDTTRRNTAPHSTTQHHTE